MRLPGKEGPGSFLNDPASTLVQNDAQKAFELQTERQETKSVKNCT